MRQATLLLAVAALTACASRAPAPSPLPPAAPPPPPPAVEPEPEPPAPSPARLSGERCVSLISVRTLAKAGRLRNEYAQKNYPVGIETVEIDGTTWHRVLFTGLMSREDARRLLPQLEQEFGVSGGWVPLQCSPQS